MPLWLVLKMNSIYYDILRSNKIPEKVKHILNSTAVACFEALFLVQIQVVYKPSCMKAPPFISPPKTPYKDVYSHVFVTSTPNQRLWTCILLIQYSTKEYGFDSLKSPGDEADSFCFNWV